MYSTESYSSAGVEQLSSLAASLAQELNDSSLQIDVDHLGASTRFCKTLPGARRLLIIRGTPVRLHVALFELSGERSRDLPCPECFERRLQSALTVPEQAALMEGFEQQGHDSPFLLDSVKQNITLSIRQIVAQSASEKNAQLVFSINVVTQQVSVSELMIDSFCSRCDAEQQVSKEDAVIPIRPALQARSGKSRMKGLTDYDLPMRALVNDVCGATCLHAVFGYAQSVTAPLYGQYAQRAFDVAPRIVSWSGMCTRADESRAAGVLEALERQAGMLAHPDRIVAFDSYRNLQQEAMDPELCFSYNEESYALPLGLTRYSPDLKMAWQWGYSLLQNRPVLVPRQLVYYDRIPKSTVKLLDNSSSGCALGSCFEEALLRALLELVERDSFVIAWFRQIALPRIDPKSCTDRKTRLILDRIEFLGYDMSLLDGRIDLRIPSVIAIGRRRDQEIGTMVVGASASADASDAIRGALLEAATSIVEVPSLLRSQEQHIRAIAEDYSQVHSVSDHGLLYGLPHMAEKLRWLDGNPAIQSVQDAFPAGEGWHSERNITADLNRCIAELARCGVSDIVAVDVTTKEQRMLGLCTVRMIVPGLAPLDFGYPRNRVEQLPRFWSAPEAAGLQFVGEERINPLPHPFP